MNQQANNSLGDMLSGLSQVAGGVDSLMDKLNSATTPEMLANMPADKRLEIESLKKQAAAAGAKVKPEADKAMAAATDMLRKAGINL